MEKKTITIRDQMENITIYFLIKGKLVKLTKKSPMYYEHIHRTTHTQDMSSAYVAHVSIKISVSNI